MSKRTTIAFVAAVTLFLGGCGSSQKKTANQNQSASDAKAKKATLSPKPVSVTGVSKEGEEIAFAPIYFDFEKSYIRPEFRPILEKLAAMMTKRPKMTLLVEGHCDERGTEEYNIALGDRRARAIRDHLTSLGVAESRISLISYGEERPAVEGHDETSWAKNRRGELTKQK